MIRQLGDYFQKKKLNFQLTNDVDGTLMIDEGYSAIFDVDVLLPSDFVLHAEPPDNFARNDSRNTETVWNQLGTREPESLAPVASTEATRRANTYRAFKGHRGLNKYSGIGTTITMKDIHRMAVSLA